MQRWFGAFFLFAFVAMPMQPAGAGSLPDIKINPKNPVPACATPGRMMEYLKSRNPELNPRYEGVATEYMRIGEALGVRWDYAFYQMIIETGSLTYRRDVKPAQNNFAGLGATGNGESGDSFRDIASGVRGHIEHLLLYAGEKLDNPVAERTRKVQEWGLLTSWQARFTKPITFADLAAKWAPGSGAYGKMLEAIAERFQEFCAKPDPRPELVAEARGQQAGSAQTADAKPAERPSGTELARRAIDESKEQESQARFGLGVQSAAKPSVPFKVLNAPAIPEPEKQLAETTQVEAPAKPKEPEVKAPELKVKDAKDAAKPKTPATASALAAMAAKSSAPADKAPLRMASAAGGAKPLVEPPSAGQKCRVWTASYGGQKAMIIRSLVDKVVNFTVLDVNEGAEAREAEAFIAAYAKDGKIAGEFGSQSQALDKAFELCPEG